MIKKLKKWLATRKRTRAFRRRVRFCAEELLRFVDKNEGHLSVYALEAPVASVELEKMIAPIRLPDGVKWFSNSYDRTFFLYLGKKFPKISSACYLLAGSGRLSGQNLGLDTACARLLPSDRRDAGRGPYAY